MISASGTSSDGSAYHASGAGPAVVFLHGVGLNQSIWAEQVKAFSPGHTVITYDLLGHGKSAAAPADAGLDDWVLQLERLAAELAIDRFTLVGFSFGGMIAQAFAARHADRIDKLVLMSTVYGRSEQERAGVVARLDVAQREGPSAIIAAALSRWFSPGFGRDNPDMIKTYDAMLRANDPQSFLAAYTCFATGDKALVNQLAGFDRPVLVMTGELDMGSTPDMARRMAGVIPGASCSIVPDARHMMPVELPAVVNAILARFFGEERP